MNATPRSQQTSRLLRTSGFLVDDIHVETGFSIFVSTRIDDLGVGIRYVIGIGDAGLPDGAIEIMQRVAAHHGAALIAVSDDRVVGVPWLDWTEFLARFGGVIPSLLPLEPGYSDRLIQLGRNARPADLTDGAVDRLYESYVGAGLEFLVGSRVIRYGSERLFEPVPDGVLLPYGERIAFLYDAKAAGPAFEIARDDVRRFADYVNRFNESYQAHSGPVRSLVVVSTEWEQNEASRRGYSEELFAMVGVPISFLRSQDLAEATALLGASPWMRIAIRWREILTPVDITSASVRAAITTIEADRVKA